MKITNEEIKKILDGAPDGAIYYQVNSYVDGMGLVWRDGRWVDFGWDGAGTPLSTLREILELRQEVERLKAQLPKWVSVEDDLPEIGQDVLVYPIKMHLGDEPVYSAHLTKSENWEYIWAGAIYNAHGITHWMPLPQPPKEQGHE